MSRLRTRAVALPALSALLLLAGCGGSTGEPVEGQPASILLPGIQDWTTTSCGPCDSWVPSGKNEVIRADVMRTDYLGRAPRDKVIVVVVPFDAALPGENWPEFTKSWKTIDGHELGRLSGGILTDFPLRAADAVTCSDCDQVIVVTGPDKAEVRRMVDRVQVGPPDAG
jgi:hypothetical protein